MRTVSWDYRFVCTAADAHNCFCRDTFYAIWNRDKLYSEQQSQPDCHRQWEAEITSCSNCISLEINIIKLLPGRERGYFNADQNKICFCAISPFMLADGDEKDDKILSNQISKIIYLEYLFAHSHAKLVSILPYFVDINHFFKNALLPSICLNLFLLSSLQLESLVILMLWPPGII